MNNSIKKTVTDNLGGLNHIRFVPARLVNSISPVYNGAIHLAVELKANAAWYELPYSIETLGFKDEQQESEHGAYYTKQITAIVPQHNDEKNNFLSVMDNERFIVDCLDNNGKRRLVGTIAEPMQLKKMADTKNNVAGRNEYQLTFTGTGTQLSPFYYPE